MQAVGWSRVDERGDRGAVALEFAILVPLLMMLLVGMLEFGFMFQAQLAVTHAAREGARMASVGDGSQWNPAVVEQRAFPLTTADGLSISLTQPDADSVRVTVAYPWTWRVIPRAPFINLGDPPILTSSATMRKE